MLEQINKTVTELKNLSGSTDLVTKLKLAEELAAESYYLSEMVAVAYENMNTAEYFWKSVISTAIAKTTGPVSKAEAVAKDTHKNLYKEYLDADSRHKKLYLLLSATNTLIEQARQSCSFLKQEYRNHGA